MSGRSAPSRQGTRRRLRAVLAAALLTVGMLAAAAAPAVAQQQSSTATQQLEVTVPSARPTLRWGINAESNGGAFFGGCNFLSAGIAGDVGGSQLWTEDDGLYRAEDGNVRIEKPAANGRYELASWDARCLDRHGQPVAVGRTEQATEAQVVIRDGERTEDEATGRTTIAWEGSFTVAFYGGLTYWSASDPVLRLEADGTGQLTAIASGYGSDMDDLSKWVELEPTEIVLADLSGVEVGPSGLAVVPDYLGIAVDVPGTAQAARDQVNEPWWGAFPSSFVDFQVRMGQDAYWYTSNGLRDRAKPPVLLEVLYGHAAEPAVPPEPPSPPALPSPPPPGAPGGGGPGGSGPGGGGPGGAGPIDPPPGGAVSGGDGAGGAGGSAGDGDGLPWPTAVLGQTVLGAAAGGGLVPVVDVARRVLTTPVLLGTAGVLAAASALLVLWRRGLLVLPWRS